MQLGICNFSYYILDLTKEAASLLHGYLRVLIQQYCQQSSSRSEKHGHQKNILAVSDAPVRPLSGVPKFDLSELEGATNNFSRILGGSKEARAMVYKGKLRGTDVAIKSYVREDQFSEERARDGLTLVSKLEHENIVKLLGYATDFVKVQPGYVNAQAKKTYCLLVVQEYMKNGSLDDKADDPELLDWSSRLQIIKGTARGLCYLHKRHAIHSNLKSSNILLAYDMTPKICDFRVTTVLDRDPNTAARDACQTGYMVPDFLDDRLTTKVDVYLFGVILLETISRVYSGDKRENSRRDSITWAWKVQRKMCLLKCKESDYNEVERCVKIGLLCTQEKPEFRPTIQEILEMLDGNKEIKNAEQPPYVNLQERQPIDCWVNILGPLKK